MCKFFSLDSDGNGKIMYFDWELRKQVIDGKLNYEPDSHTSIADYFGYRSEKEDKLNKYEYNPLTKEFNIDQLNTTDDSVKIKKFCEELDFKTIIPQLIIKPIINPFKDRNITEITEEDIELVKKWASVRALVGVSIRSSVWASVRDSVGASVGASVRDSVWDSVGALVGDSVWDSVWDSVGDSVGDSVRAYISSFFTIAKWEYIKHEKGVNPYQPAIDLWEKGLVPSYDGKLWRLHGKGGKILWTGKGD